MTSSRDSHSRNDRSAPTTVACGLAANHRHGLVGGHRAHRRGSLTSVLRGLGGLVGALVTVSTAHGQILGTGGSTATTGSLTTTDFFIGAQKVQNINLNDRDRANFLNQASCYCQKPVWVKALLQPSATARALLVPATATVSLYVGTACDQNLVPATCLPLSTGTPFSQFRLNGLLVPTTVNVLARQYSTNYPWDRTSPQGDTRTDSCVATTTDFCASATATGGASGSGGTSGSGGEGGLTGSGGDTGSGGAAGSGGDSGTGGATGVITGASSQGIYLFVSTTGEGYHDIADVQTQWVLDMTPPCPPTDLALAPANQALITTWTAVDATLSGNDLLGYQLLCTRGLETDPGLQVFKSGTFTAAFDDRCSTDSSPFARVDPAFVCSDLLSSAATSDRLKILENGISYGVGVLAVDNHRNGSLLTPRYNAPVETRNFYQEYRNNGTPQGQSQGGFCSVEPPTQNERSRDALAVGLGSAVVGCGLLIFRRRRSGRRRP